MRLSNYLFTACRGRLEPDNIDMSFCAIALRRDYQIFRSCGDN